MSAQSNHRTRLVTMLSVGLIMGAGAALVAGALVAQRATSEANRLDSISSLSEASIRVRSAVNQSVLVSATDSAGGVRMHRISLAEANATLESLTRHSEAIDPTDTVLTAAASQYGAAAADIVESLVLNGADDQPPPSLAALELSQEVLSDVMNDRRQSARVALASAEAGGGMAAVLATSLVILILPTVAITIFSRSSRDQGQGEGNAPEPATEPIGVPIRLTRELEDRAAGVVDHARLLFWSRPPGNEVASYRGLLAEAGSLLNVTRNLMTFHRLQAGEMLVSAEPTALFALVARVRMAALDVGLTLEVVDEDVVVIADAVRLHQTIENLVGVLAGHGATRIGVVPSSRKGTGSICVVGDDCDIPREVLRGLQDWDGQPPCAAALALTVSRRLISSMSGDLSHRHVQNASVFTIELALAGGRMP